MSDLLRGLNDNQRRAVESIEGYTRVIAGPGSGKTKTLTTTYATLIDEIGVPESSILCITFTNKAMREIKDRVKIALGRPFDSNLITTYHGFCLKVLKDNMGYFHYPKTINILDDEDKKSLLKEVYKELGLNAKNYSYRAILGKISAYKSVNVEESVEFLSNPSEEYINNKDFFIKDEMFKKILVAYLKKQRQTYYLDFDDIINFVYVLFKDKKAYISNNLIEGTQKMTVLEYYQNKINYILIDEYQDSDNIQIEIAKMLSGKSGNLFVVGDPDQSIYEWRGAKPQYFVDFDKYNKDCTDIVLNQNYRSTKRIVKASNALIKNNKVRLDKDMVTDNEEGKEIIHYHGNSDSDEANWVAQRIKELIESGANSEEIAILYRSNYQSRFIEESLLKNGISYSIWGGTKFFERMEIKDLVSYLKLIQSNDDVAFRRVVNVPKRKMGNKKIEFIENIAQQNDTTLFEALLDTFEDKIFKSTNIKLFIDAINHCRENKLSPSKAIDHILKSTGYEEELRRDSEEDRLDNISELVRFAREFETSDDVETGSIEEFLDYISLYTDKDDNNPEANIKLLTMHTSKGLEFDHVFVIGLTDGIIPNAKAVSERGSNGLEEERRTMYVAITRARKELYLSDASGFTYDGKEKETSRFINEIGEENFKKIGYESKPKSNLSRNQKPMQNFMIDSIATRFEVGDLVHHKIFGIAKIIKVDDVSQSYVLEFNNDKVKDTRIISMKYTGLSKI